MFQAQDRSETRARGSALCEVSFWAQILRGRSGSVCGLHLTFVVVNRLTAPWRQQNLEGTLHDKATMPRA